MSSLRDNPPNLSLKLPPLLLSASTLRESQMGCKVSGPSAQSRQFCSIVEGLHTIQWRCVGHIASHVLLHLAALHVA